MDPNTPQQQVPPTPPLSQPIMQQSIPEQQQSQQNHSTYFSFYSKLLVAVIGIISIILVVLGVYMFVVKKNQSLIQSMQKKQTIINQAPTVPAAAIPTLSPTANWKTYIDPKFGFSLKYPPDWIFNSTSEQNQTGTDFKTGKPYFMDTHTVWFAIPSIDPKKVRLNIQIEIHTNINNWNLSQWINEETYGNGISYLGTTKQLTIDGQPAIEGTRPPDTKDVYTVSKPDSQGRSVLYDFTLYGNGGAINGGAGGETINPTQAFLAQLQLYDPNDPFLIKQIQAFETMLSTFTFTSQNEAANNSTCTTSQADIVSLVNNFETLQMQRNATGVLALFSLPVTQDEINNYSTLSGKDTNSLPRLFNNVTTNFKEYSYKLINSPVTNQTGGCTINVEEQDAGYSNAGSTVGYTAPHAVDNSLDVINQSGLWKVDKYYPTGKTPSKFAAYGYFNTNDGY